MSLFGYSRRTLNCKPVNFFFKSYSFDIQSLKAHISTSKKRNRRTDSKESPERSKQTLHQQDNSRPHRSSSSIWVWDDIIWVQWDRVALSMWSCSTQHTAPAWDSSNQLLQLSSSDTHIIGSPQILESPVRLRLLHSLKHWATHGLLTAALTLLAHCLASWTLSGSLS